MENLDWLLDKNWKPTKVTLYTNRGENNENK